MPRATRHLAKRYLVKLRLHRRDQIKVVDRWFDDVDAAAESATTMFQACVGWSEHHEVTVEDTATGRLIDWSAVGSQLERYQPGW